MPMSEEEIAEYHAWMAYQVAELVALRPFGRKWKGAYSKRSVGRRACSVAGGTGEGRGPRARQGRACGHLRCRVRADGV
jgi:hypothetical protein